MSADTRIPFTPALAGLERAAWLAHLEDIADDHGSYNFLGKRHTAALIEGGPDLLVTFEVVDTIIDADPEGEPAGFAFVRYDGWTHLGIYAHAENWFRDPYVYAYFDRLTDDGFFDRFDNVLFYGVGSGGYAAAAYSVAAPGARVLAIRPQATLDPRVTGFDPRFTGHRRLDFHSRYGYAPDMVDAAGVAYVAFDPLQKMDAVHAALFTRANVHALRCTGFGARIDQAFQNMEIFGDVMRAAMQGTLTDLTFARLMRARRDYVPYLRKVFNEAMRRERPSLAATVCAHALRQDHAKFFSERLDELEDQGHFPLGPKRIKAAE